MAWLDPKKTEFRYLDFEVLCYWLPKLNFNGSHKQNKKEEMKIKVFLFAAARFLFLSTKR